MKLAVFGISHHTCCVAHREKLNLSQDEQTAILHHMHSSADFVEGLVVNTCNRLEFYFYSSKAFDAASFVATEIAKLRPHALELWLEHHYEHSGINVVGHLFKVAAGLDSQMIGESQIVSQLKSAYAASLECRTSKFLFHRLMHSAFHVGKAVRTQTEINCGSISISLAAVEYAKQFAALTDSTVMVIGAGENSDLAATYLIKNEVKHLIVANRKAENAAAMVGRLKAGRAISLEQIPENLGDTDVVIASTAATEPIVRAEQVKTILASRTKPLLVLDLAVPRDIDPEIGKISGVSLRNIDDLNIIINGNKIKLQNQIPLALAIIEEHVCEFGQWLDSLSIVPVITELSSKTIGLARSEARRYAGSIKGVKPEDLELFAESLAKKILHGPISFLKANGDDEPTFEQLQAINLVNKMFFPQKPPEHK